MLMCYILNFKKWRRSLYLILKTYPLYSLVHLHSKADIHLLPFLFGTDSSGCSSRGCCHAWESYSSCVIYKKYAKDNLILSIFYALFKKNSHTKGFSVRVKVRDRVLVRVRVWLGLGLGLGSTKNDSRSLKKTIVVHFLKLIVLCVHGS